MKMTLRRRVLILSFGVLAINTLQITADLPVAAAAAAMSEFECFEPVAGTGWPAWCDYYVGGEAGDLCGHCKYICEEDEGPGFYFWECYMEPWWATGDSACYDAYGTMAQDWDSFVCPNEPVGGGPGGSG